MSTCEKVIVVYLDDYDKIDTEFSWLYKTWKLHALDQEFDLLVFYSPTALNRLYKYPGIRAVEMPDIGLSKEYPFLKSSYMFNEPWCVYIRPYKYVFKTDCDVFLTQHLKQYVPHLLLLGKGEYYDSSQDQFIQHLKWLSTKFGWTYRYLTNVGSSLFGDTQTVISICQLINSITEQILKNEWFGPFKQGVTSMIAAELAINAVCSQQHVVLYALDSKPWKTTKVGSDTLHIHAWHTSHQWSKHQFLSNQYQDWKIESYEKACDNAANYCQWIATTPIEQIMEQRQQLLAKRHLNLKLTIDEQHYRLEPIESSTNST